MDVKGVSKTALFIHHGIFKYSPVPFELKNALKTFQRAMDATPASVKWQHATVYIDHVIILSKTLKQPLQHIEEVLRLSRNLGMTITWQNCFFFSSSIDYLGHVIAQGKLQDVQKITEAIASQQYLTTFSKLRSFLGLCNVYRRRVPKFASLTTPLRRRS